MEALRQAHADTLAAEQQKAADRYAQLQGQYDNANQQIVNLNGDIEQLKQDMTAAATRHQMQIQETNARMGERVDYFRTALEGSEPERAQQLIALDEKIMSLSRDLDAARETIASLEASNTDLGQQLANAENALEQNEQALAQAGRDMAAAANTEAAQALAAAQEELRLANEAHSAASAEASMLLENTKSAAAEAAAKAAVVLEQTKTAAAAAMQQASAEHAAEMTEAKGRIAALDQELQQEKSALAALQDKYDTTVADLNAKLADTERTLATEPDQLSRTSERSPTNGNRPRSNC